MSIDSYYQTINAQQQENIAQQKQKEAEQQKDRAVTNQANLVAAQTDIDLRYNNTDEAIISALTSLKLQNTLETRSSLINALRFSPNLVKVLDGHTINSMVAAISASLPANGVTGLGYNSRTHLLISAGRDGNIIMWNLANGQHHMLALPPYRHVGGINNLALSPDGRFLASAGIDGLWVWDANTGRQVSALQIGNNGWNSSVAFSSKNRLITQTCYKGACNDSSKMIITFWDTSTWQPLTSFSFDGSMSAIAFSPDGKFMALGNCAKKNSLDPNRCDEGSIRLWNTTTGQPDGSSIIGLDNVITSLTFSPDGLSLASGSADGTIILWNVTTRKERLAPFKGHTGAITQLRFSPDGNSLASGATDTTVRVWSVLNGNSLFFLKGHTSSITSLAFSPDGQQLASGEINERILLWSLDSSNTTTTHYLQIAPYNANSIAISPDGKLIALGSIDGKVKIIDRSSGKLLTQRSTASGCERTSPHINLNAPCYLNLITFSYDGKHLLVGANNGYFAIWDVRTWTRLPDPFQNTPLCQILGCLQNEISSSAMSSPLAFNREGSLVAIAGAERIWLWDLHKKIIKYQIRGLSGKINSLAFSPDGRILATGGTDNTIRLWNVESGTPIGHPLQGHTGEVLGLAFNPYQQNQLASRGADGTLRIWNVLTQGEIGQIASPFLDTDNMLVYSPNGRFIATTFRQGEVMLWDTATASMMYPPLGEVTSIFGVAFAPDSQTLLTMTSDWRQITHMSLYDINLNDLQQRACDIIQRNLDDYEMNGLGISLEGGRICPSYPVQNTVVRDLMNQAQSDIHNHKKSVASQEYQQITRWVLQSSDAYLNHLVCIFGSVNQFANEVLPACQHAVVLTPEEGSYVDSLGIAEALVGNNQRAIEHFQFFIDWVKANQLEKAFSTTLIQERLRWMLDLQAKRNPFSPQTLDMVWKEFSSAHENNP